MKKILFFALFTFKYIYSYQALTIEPVVDLVGCRLESQTFYKQIPYSRNSMRLHQILFNSIIEIKKKQGDEVLVEVQDVFFDKNGTKINSFWGLEKNFIPLHKIKDLSKIPNPKNKDITITLKDPFSLANTKKVFSAGTKFVIKEEKSQSFLVYFFNKKKLGFEEIEIPKNLTFLNELKNNNEKIKAFISLIKSWITLEKEIPYVLGGSTIGVSTNDIKYGVDCSGLIFRAANICDMPYYFKNTTTLIKNLKSIKPNEKLEEGDLIYVPGHVMIVSDISNAKLIEARGYSHGYGKLQEIPLYEEFKEIKTYKQLLNNFFNKKSITRINKDGKNIYTTTNFNVLKLNSVWR